MKRFTSASCRGDYENNIQRVKEYSRAAVEKGVIPRHPAHLSHAVHGRQRPLRSVSWL